LTPREDIHEILEGGKDAFRAWERCYNNDLRTCREARREMIIRDRRENGPRRGRLSLWVNLQHPRGTKRSRVRILEPLDFSVAQRDTSSVRHVIGDLDLEAPHQRRYATESTRSSWSLNIQGFRGVMESIPPGHFFAMICPFLPGRVWSGRTVEVLVRALWGFNSGKPERLLKLSYRSLIRIGPLSLSAVTVLSLWS
jgi:hypothetical protein